MTARTVTKRDSGSSSPQPRFFATPAALRRWLARNHASARELWVGLHRKGSGRASITWPELVDELLCYGWIDGVRRSLDDERYMIRVTPRQARSIWSNVNTKRVHELTRLGRMQPAGVAAFERRDAARAGVYSFERDRVALDAAYAQALRANARAWAFFQAQPPWYRKTATAWVMSAKREETRARRLATLIEDSANGARIGPLRRP